MPHGRIAYWPVDSISVLLPSLHSRGLDLVASYSYRLNPIFVPGDGLLAGRSIGKRLTGLKVIETRHGGPCTIMQDFIRHRYVLFANPIFLILSAYDSSQGWFDTPETYAVRATPLTAEEVEPFNRSPRPKTFSPLIMLDCLMFSMTTTERPNQAMKLTATAARFADAVSVVTFSSLVELPFSQWR